MRRSAVLAAALTALVATATAGCTASGATAGPSAEATTAAATDGGPSPEPTAILPGYEGWSLLGAPSVHVSLDGRTLVMTLVKRALWFQNQRGVLLWTTVSGDFRMRATVRTRATSDPSAPPATDRVQLAGLMARVEGVRENYVFIVVGSDADHDLSVETKSTTDGDSRFHGPAWPSSDADLMLCRRGTTFTLWKRPAGVADGAWELGAKVDRPDMAGDLEVGPAIYSDAAPDITARFDDMSIELLEPGQDC